MELHEKRKSNRYSREATIRLRKGEGVVRDHSADGIYFLTDQQISIGEKIEFLMNVENQAAEQQTTLRCHADVIRVDSAEEKTGVAATITRMRFHQQSAA